ncbi:phosphatidylinositol-4-phosphate 5-kinase [Trypanosoma grayi]|uniref:phosphatidylinositol-4-phosphate 5-kinase n=1 Tax=Trypanosoma grayi TaxID=71804 RepID=UPI0004F4122C|nr:phosphatidylinositol-4-phosphate 5-kinase [Trypanosoma grayi]KEG11378.1 phosphatidylinositol-4-phosphate 5-kinase [Trypanosoma grayi]
MSGGYAIDAEAPLSSPDGYVTDVQLPGNRVYTGEVSEECMHGTGCLRSELDVYTGDFRSNMRQGHGTFCSTVDVHPSGVKMYEGGWDEDERHGNGTIEWCNGDTYTGQFYRGKPHGSAGRYVFADGRVYVGGYKHGVRHGFGRLTQRNGEYYEGHFMDGAMTGEGTAWYAGGGRVYKGLWEGGRKVRGKMTFAGSSRLYDGDWLNEKPHGSGEMIFANGDHYVGEFVAGKLSGSGCITYHSLGGRSYRGAFMDDQPHGKGTVTLPNGTATEVYFMRGKQLAADDTAAIDEVSKELAALLMLHNGASNKGKKTASALWPTVKRGGSPTESPPVANLTTAQAKSSSNASPLPEPTHSTEEVAASPPLAPATETGSMELTIPRLPTVYPHGPVSDVRGSRSSLSKEETAEIMAVSAGVIAGSHTDGCKGWLEKFSIGRSRFGPSNWRRRYFVLVQFNATVALSYFRDELCRKPVSFLRLDACDTRLVTRPSIRTHKEATKPGRDLCIVYIEGAKEYKLLLRADTEEEHDYWVDELRKPFAIVDYPSDYPLLACSQE